MKIVIDDKIPYIKDVIEQIADEVVYLNGSDITANDVKDANAIIIRTRTKCDEDLLKNSNVEFIATATIGFDHIDTKYMDESGIEWMNCPGCNAGSVAQYLRSTLILLNRYKGLVLEKSTIGIVGCGHVGTLVQQVAEELGMKVIINDPPRQARGDAGNFVELEEIVRDSDVITFHVPLIHEGKYNTFHLADEDFFSNLKHQPFIINTSRGPIIDNQSLLKSIINGKIRDAIIDTWENEPDINLELLKRIFIGTPHIAGYSADGKVNADNMVIQGLCKHFRIKNRFHIEPPPLYLNYTLSDNKEKRALQLYNPLTDSIKLKSHPEQFEQLRGNYPLRREYL